MPKGNPLHYAKPDVEVEERVDWGYRVVYLFNLIGTTLSVGYFLLTLMLCRDSLGGVFGIVGVPLMLFDFACAGAPAWLTVLSMGRRPTNWRARRRLLVASLLPFVLISSGWLVLWIVPKLR
jgi:hypothetical protein